MIRWEWEGNGNNKVIPAHLYVAQLKQLSGINPIHTGCMFEIPQFPSVLLKNAFHNALIGFESVFLIRAI